MEKVKRKPRKALVNEDLCVSCGSCVKICPLNALSIFKGIKAIVDLNKCVGCGKCVRECPASVIELGEVSV